MLKMDEVSSIKTFFQSRQVHLSTGWLEGCINWCKEENLSPNYTLKDLQFKVYEQWLLLDLRDVEVPCLPPDLSNKTKYILNGNYSLQMMKVIDISKPKYWQLQKIRNNSVKTAEPEVESSKRVLQLTLTDGVQNIEAMEYKPISCLNLNLTPGIKIRLMGPITVRRGRLMLEEKNVKVLGGEVEDLIIPNAAENILATFLKLPLNPKPNVIEESLLSADTDILAEAGENRSAIQDQNNIRNILAGPASTTTNNTTVQNKNNMRNNVHSAVASNITTVQNQSSTRGNLVNPYNNSKRNIQQNHQGGIVDTSNIPSSSTRQNVNQMIDFNEEEELRIAAEIEMLMEVERDLEEQPTKKRKSNRTPDLFDDSDINDSIFENIDIPPTVIKRSSIPKQKPLQNENKIENTLNVHESLEIGNDLFENMDVDAHLNQITKESSWKPITPPKPLVLTIEKLLKNMPNISNGKFKIKARFCSVVEKLTVADDDYHLVIKVADDTADLVVKIHTDVVSDMAGCCPLALMSLRTGVIENNTEAQNKILETLRMVKDKLVQLNHIMEVQINVKEKFPVIVNIL